MSNRLKLNYVCLNTVNVNRVGQISKVSSVPPTPSEIKDAVLLSGGQGALLLTDGSYLKLTPASTTQQIVATKKKTNYWRF